MLIERLENYYRDLAAKRNEWQGNWARASSLGYCPRRLGYQKLGVKGEPLTPRRISIFHHGDAIDLALKQDLMHALDGSIITEKHRGSVEIEGITINGECDGLFYVDDRYGVVDGKTMSDLGFDRACNGEIEETYQIQGWVYSKIYGVDLVVFYCYRKETSHVVEVVFDGRAEGLVITRRFGGNEREIYTQDPLLIAEVKTPFSPEIEAKARQTIRDVSACTSFETLPVGVNKIEPERIKCQSKESKQDAVSRGLTLEKTAGSWATFLTGRKVLGFPCTYCPFYKHCFPSAQLEFDNGKPKWVLP
jgi:hypothetical protein